MTIRNPVRYILVLLSFLMLTACGGGGGTSPPANTDCVLGESKIGECEI